MSISIVLGLIALALSVYALINMPTINKSKIDEIHQLRESINKYRNNENRNS